jgi:NAD(P)-dependent dehydrogenase (short-subunit alcohol dehydrogenase family)
MIRCLLSSSESTGTLPYYQIGYVFRNAIRIGIPMEGVYAASKARLERVNEALSIEASYRGIRPVIIQPGNVNTGFN